MDRRLHKAQNDVEVVHHQVEDHVDVEGARAEDAEPVRLEEHGVVQDGHCGDDGGIETLQMARLQNATVVRGERNEAARFADAGGDRFLDKNVDAGSQQSFAHLEMD